MSGSLQAQEDRRAHTGGDRGSPVAIEEGTARAAANTPLPTNLQFKRAYDFWLQRSRTRHNFCPQRISATPTPSANSRSPSEVTGPCPGGRAAGASCCDCSKSLGGNPGCCLACPAGKTACCIVGGSASCLPAEGCCSDADCTGGQVCQTTDKPFATCSCPSRHNALRRKVR